VVLRVVVVVGAGGGGGATAVSLPIQIAPRGTGKRQPCLKPSISERAVINKCSIGSSRVYSSRRLLRYGRIVIWCNEFLWDPVVPTP